MQRCLDELLCDESNRDTIGKKCKMHASPASVDKFH